MKRKYRGCGLKKQRSVRSALGIHNKKVQITHTFVQILMTPNIVHVLDPKFSVNKYIRAFIAYLTLVVYKRVPRSMFTTTNLSRNLLAKYPIALLVLALFANNPRKALCVTMKPARHEPISYVLHK